MTIQDKYPNADTSPERLAEIQQEYEDYAKPDGKISLTTTHYNTRDLLAMLHERALETQAMAHEIAREGYTLGFNCEKTILDNVKLLVEKFKTEKLAYEIASGQLHDQRWRRSLDELPPENTKVQIEYNKHTAIWYWWRPIPPLPKE